jgi:hypothetical protein
MLASFCCWLWLHTCCIVWRVPMPPARRVPRPYVRRWLLGGVLLGFAFGFELRVVVGKRVTP